MTGIRTHSRAPPEYSSQGTVYGSNSKIYLDIVNELTYRENEVEQIQLALYLFNNRQLYSKLLGLAKKGARIKVTSLPLTGYDRRKLGSAKSVYYKALKDGTITLQIFPHMYMWYGALYAGGGASYSFHVKSGMIEYKDGTSKVFLTSGNLAPGDPTHSETAVFAEALHNSSLIEMFKAFFDEIEKRSKPFEDYNKLVRQFSPELQQVLDFSFIGGVNVTNFETHQASSAFFTAPFITFGSEGSNHYARKRLVEIVLSAKKRLLVCAQHSHDISPFNGYPEQTMIDSIIQTKRANPNIDVKVLKQVASSGLADKRRAAFVEGHLYHAGVPQRVNKLVHDKFVVADNTVVVTTGNFTATQFGWGERRMEFKTDTDNLKAVQNVIDSATDFFGTPKGYVFARMTRPRKGAPKVKVLRNDTFSEVNAYMVIKDFEVAEHMAKYFEELWNHRLSADVEIPM